MQQVMWLGAGLIARQTVTPAGARIE